MSPAIVPVPPHHWDRLFAPSSCLAVITTVNAAGAINAAAFGTCTRVCHEPVYIAFTTGFRFGSHTGNNVAATNEFVVNLPAFDKDLLDRVCVTGMPFAEGVNELDKAGLTQVPSTIVRPPRIAECVRHFECQVEWTRDWANRRMVVGKVVAASAHEGAVDDNGYVKWDVVLSTHYCGAHYGHKFVAAYETLAAEPAYHGPEADVYAAMTKKAFGI